MDQDIRNKLRNVVTQCRKLLEDAISQELEGKYGIFARKDRVTADPDAPMTHLTDEEQASRRDLLDHFAHIQARGFKPKDALDQLVREIAFTHLNRLCAYKMMEAREVYVGGQKFREAVSRGVNSNGVKFYLAEHEDDERLFNTGHQDVAYRHFLDWLGAALSEEIGVLFSPNDPANRLYPRQKTLDEVLDLLNGGGIKAEDTKLREEWPKIWSQDETIGWVYQYFTPKELRDQARKESQAPRNSYELAFRNQFFTPRYVVEFLTDNTLGRIWYEMRRGETRLKDQCRYLVRRPTEIFLNPGEQPPKDDAEGRGDLSQEALLKLPVHIPHRPKKDPRELKILDPACGSGHFLLYCFDLLLTIYEEAYADPDLGPALQQDYPTLDDLRRDVPRLILAHNLHGIDIDGRASQIAALALWLRCQRAYQDMGLKKDRPRITRSNVVCAEPMPGEARMLKEFVDQLEPRVLGQVVEVVFDRMKLAGEAGSLLKIEEEIRDAVAAARKQWDRETAPAMDRRGQPLLFAQAELDRLDGGPVQQSLFDLSDITDTEFFEQAESKVIDALRRYAEGAQNGQRLQRRLFAEDAVRGFAFVDLCQKRYDVVLMNPPFGEVVPSSKLYLSEIYSDCAHDLCAAIISRYLDALMPKGLLGAITTRTALFIQSFEAWRTSILEMSQFLVVADLGYGVLDAMVETAMYILRKDKIDQQYPTAFISCLESTEKEDFIKNALFANNQKVIWRFLDEFIAVPGKPLAYWIPTSLLDRFRILHSFRSYGGIIRQGVQTADDFRFLRLYWEVDRKNINTRGHEEDRAFISHSWAPMTKGGEYSPWWDDVHLVLLWHNNGDDIKNFTNANGKLRSRPQNISHFFKAGLTYPYRTTSSFWLRCLPAGCAFSGGGWALFPPQSSDHYETLAIYNSRIARYFMEVLLGQGDSSVSGSAARNHVAESVGGIPWPENKITPDICFLIEKIIVLWRDFVANETCTHFALPRLLRNDNRSVYEALVGAWNDHCDTIEKLLIITHEIEQSVQVAYRLTPLEVDVIYKDEGLHPCAYSNASASLEMIEKVTQLTLDQLIELCQKECGSKRYIVKKSYFADRKIEIACHYLKCHPSAVLQVFRRSIDNFFEKQAIEELVSYFVGVIFGRWDVCSKKYLNKLSNPPLSVLPTSAPGMLQNSCGEPATTVSEDYPITIQWDGVLVDDPDHICDIIRQMQKALDTIWLDAYDSIESDIIKILSAKNLREYFRKPGRAGFWIDHVSRYSKSRRNGPIYWLLQSSKKNYAIWLYYHRLDKDLLFKALVNYVEPKIRMETTRLETLLSDKAAAGESSKDAKRLAKEAERQEDFLSELRDFEDKLRRAANLHLEPDLNDGVVLNIAPLHELVPWKEAKKYWDELLAGKYEWSAIGKQLREKGLVS